MRPVVEIEKKDKQINIHLAARSTSEAKQILQGIAKKYPIKLDEALAATQVKREHIDEYVEFNLAHGGTDTFRAIVKIAYLFLKLRKPVLKLDTEADLIAFIKVKRDFRFVYYFYPEKEFVEKQPGQILHSIVIKSYPAEKMLVAYIELFSVFSFAVLLSSNFSEDIEETYVFDLISLRELNPPNLNIPTVTLKTLNHVFTAMPSPTDSVTKKYENFLRFALQRQHAVYQKEMIERALQKSLKRYPEGTVITKEMMNEFHSALMEEITPYIIHAIKRTE